MLKEGYGKGQQLKRVCFKVQIKSGARYDYTLVVSLVSLSMFSAFTSFLTVSALMLID